MIKYTYSLFIFLFLFSALSSKSYAVEYEKVTLYSWRPQEKEFWGLVNERGLVPGVWVDFRQISSGEYNQALQYGINKNIPDLFQERPSGALVGRWVKSGVIRPINPGFIKNIFPAALKAVSYRNSVYGIPFAIEIQSIIYNRKIFEKYKIQEPQSLNDLYRAFVKLNLEKIVPMHFSIGTGWWGSQILSEVMAVGMLKEEKINQLVEGKACFTDPEFVAIFSELLRWKKNKYINSDFLQSNYNNMRTAVALGNSAMMIDGLWSVSIESPMFEINRNLRLGFFPFPGIKGLYNIFADGGYFVNYKSPKRAAALKVLAFTASKRFAELYADITGSFPAYQGNLKLRDNLLALKYSKISSQVASSSLFFEPSLSLGDPSYGSLLGNALQEVLAEKITPSEAADKIQRGLNSWNYIGAKKCR